MVIERQRSGVPPFVVALQLAVKMAREEEEVESKGEAMMLKPNGWEVPEVPK